MHIYGVAKYIKFMLLLMNKWRNCPLSMYAHNVLGYISGMHPNLSKVTMHLNPFWTNYPTHLYKPLIATNGKQKSSNLTVWMYVYTGVWVHTSTATPFIFFFINSPFFLFCFVFYTHRHTKTPQSKAISTCTDNVLSEYWTLCLHQTINWQLQIAAMR